MPFTLAVVKDARARLLTVGATITRVEMSRNSYRALKNNREVARAWPPAFLASDLDEISLILVKGLPAGVFRIVTNAAEFLVGSPFDAAVYWKNVEEDVFALFDVAGEKLGEMTLKGMQSLFPSDSEFGLSNIATPDEPGAILRESLIEGRAVDLFELIGTHPRDRLEGGEGQGGVGVRTGIH